MMEEVSSEELVRLWTRKLAPPLVTLLSAEPEVQYVALRNIRLIVQRWPGLLAHEVKVRGSPSLATHTFCSTTSVGRAPWLWRNKCRLRAHPSHTMLSSHGRMCADSQRHHHHHNNDSHSHCPLHNPPPLFAVPHADTHMCPSNQVFFVKYNDPIYVKLEKLEVMVALASDANIDQVLLEFKEYAQEVDVDFVRRVRAWTDRPHSTQDRGCDVCEGRGRVRVEGQSALIW